MKVKSLERVLVNRVWGNRYMAHPRQWLSLGQLKQPSVLQRFELWLMYSWLPRKLTRFIDRFLGIFFDVDYFHDWPYQDNHGGNWEYIPGGPNFRNLKNGSIWYGGKV